MVQIEGKDVYLGDKKVTLILNNEFVLVDGQDVSPFNPSKFNNIQYWWTADEGITTATGGVSVWKDQINNTDLIQGNSANRPSSTTNATLNNQNVVAFNGSSDFLYVTSAPASLSSKDFTHLIVYDLNSTAGNGVIAGFVLIAVGGLRYWHDILSGNHRIFSEGMGSATNIESPATTGAHTLKLRYDSSNGNSFYALDTTTESTWGTGGTTNGDWVANSVISMGATLNSRSNPTVFSSRYANVDVAEWAVIYGTPTADEMNDWKEYVNTKYGTIVS